MKCSVTPPEINPAKKSQLVQSIIRKATSLESRLLKSEDEIAEYEKILYREFSRKNPDNWLCRNYLLVDGNRYRSPISYSTQSIYAVFEESRIISAIAINFDVNRKTQFEAIGFNLKKDLIDCHYCEALNFFICQQKIHNSFEIWRRLRKVVVEDLKAKKILFMLSTCSSNVLPLYLRYGCSVVKKKILNKEVKYLIKLEIIESQKSKSLSMFVS